MQLLIIYDSLAENDTILDEFLQMPAQEEEEEGAEVEVLDDVEELEIEKEQEVTININLEEGKFRMGDMVVMRTDQLKGAPMKVVGMRKMFGSPLHAISVETQTGDTVEYDETQLVKLPEKKNNLSRKNLKYLDDGTVDFIPEVEGEVQTEEMSDQLKA